MNSLFYENKLTPVNEDQKQFYDNCYEVYLWTGSGYALDGFMVYANNELNALELVVAYCDNKGLYAYLIPVEDVEDEDDDQFIYIDATMDGATKPYYIYNELRILDRQHKLKIERG